MFFEYLNDHGEPYNDSPKRTTGIKKTSTITFWSLLEPTLRRNGTVRRLVAVLYRVPDIDERMSVQQTQNRLHHPLTKTKISQQ